MEKTGRSLIFAVLVVVLIGGLETTTTIDVPGVDLDLSHLAGPGRVEVDRLPFLDELRQKQGPPRPSGLQDSLEESHVSIASWNLSNFGRTKDKQEIQIAADVLNEFDVVAIQEVVTSPPGAQAVAKLDAALDRTGFAWDYRISDPTTGDGTERYAFAWKPSRVRLVGRAWLESSLSEPIDREPFLARFKHRATGATILLATFHAVPRSKNPEREIALLEGLHRRYESDHLVVLGDFNLDEDDEAFNGLRQNGYRPVLDDQKTSLRRSRDPGPNGHLANPYDNIFVESDPLHVTRGGAIDFTTQFSSLSQARSLSDHLPVFVDIRRRTGGGPVAP